MAKMAKKKPALGTTVPVVVEVGNDEIKFEITADGEGPAYFCMGVRKSGSTMLRKIVMFLANKNGLNAVDIPGTFFEHGYTVHDWSAVDLSSVVQPANVYVGFRAFPKLISETDVFKNAPKIFMFRDPRDALVSQYFSDAYSHPLPRQSAEGAGKGREIFLKKRAAARTTDIDDYVVSRSSSMRDTLLACKPLMDDPACLKLRYEDYVFQKKRLITKILAHFNWSCHPGQVENLLKMVDIVPDAENKTNFVRKALPGDHRAKLKPEVIRLLDKRLSEVLALYDYY
jgi:hypothetical protein